MKQKMYMIGFVIFISSVILSCTTPLVTLKIEEAAIPKRPLPYPTTRPLSCTVYTDGSGTETSTVDVDARDDQFPRLPPMDEARKGDYEYVTNHLLDYIEKLQEYIRENP